MMEAAPPIFTYRCDVCGRSERGDSPDGPPPGFATIVSHARTGTFVTTHACTTACLVRAAMGVAGQPRRRTEQ